jgi:regulator of replication initiation timing
VNNLATEYWHKIRELESALNKALKRIDDLEKKVKMLRKENMELKIENAQLKEMLFGNGKHGGGETGLKVAKIHEEKEQRLPRNAASYRRAKPKKVNVVQPYSLDECRKCRGGLKFLKTIIRYIEDIPLPMEKIVTKEEIGVYRCLKCGEKQYGKEMNLQGSAVTLGPNVKQFILYALYLEHLTFQKIENHLVDLYSLKISDGEIQNILVEAAQKLEPRHLKIRKQIRRSPAVHMDETSWNQSGEKGYGWGMFPADGQEVSFEIADTRGKGIAEKMLGKNFQGTVISDFYRGYKNLASSHQGCWVHLLGDFHELASNGNIPKRYRKLVKKRYEDLAVIYHKIKIIHLKPFDLNERENAHENFKKQLLKFSKLSQGDISLKKLKNLKLRIVEYLEELLVGIVREGVPLQNNKAEQALRQLVLKRKISFGSRSKQGCKTLAINLSVLLTLWRTSRKTFFPQLAQLLG